jgi:hypothetical protein
VQLQIQNSIVGRRRGGHLWAIEGAACFVVLKGKRYDMCSLRWDRKGEIDPD